MSTMLTVYPRHLAVCEAKLKAKGLSPTERRSWKRCGCPLWIIGNDPRGEWHRRSLNTTSWEVAEELKRDIERGIEKPAPVEIATALTKWKDALLAAKRKPRTVAHVHGAMANSLSKWASHRGLTHLNELNLELLNEWVCTWDCANTTHRGRIDLARQFFKFAIAHKWIAENPAADIIKPGEEFAPTLPFTVEEEAKIFEAAAQSHTWPHKGGLWLSNPETAHALALVMRWTGLRASDSVQFEPQNIKAVDVDGKQVAVYQTYQTKTKEWVMCPIPPDATEAIIKAPRLSKAYAFMPSENSGYKTDPHSVAISFHQSYLDRLSARSGVPEVRPHRFRDTFAVRLLEQGKPLEVVQMLLGHRSILTTQKHYAPWVKSRQQMLIREVMTTWTHG